MRRSLALAIAVAPCLLAISGFARLKHAQIPSVEPGLYYGWVTGYDIPESYFGSSGPKHTLRVPVALLIDDRGHIDATYDGGYKETYYPPTTGAFQMIPNSTKFEGIESQPEDSGFCLDTGIWSVSGGTIRLTGDAQVPSPNVGSTYGPYRFAIIASRQG